MDTIESLNARVDALCHKFGVPTDPYLLSMHAAGLEAGLRTHRLVRVSGDYYDQPLTERAVQVGTQPERLCKTLVIFNKFHPTPSDMSNPAFSPYYMVVVPYNRRILSHELWKTIRNLSPDQPKRFFKTDSAPADVALALTGFTFNGITPLGSKTRIPLVVDAALKDLQPPYIYLGGGQIDVKLGCSLSELERAFGPAYYGAFTEPRAENDPELYGHGHDEEEGEVEEKEE